MSEFEKLKKSLANEGYKCINTRKKDFGKRLIFEKHRRGRANFRILVYHFKRKPSVKDFLKFIMDFEKFFEKFDKKGDYYLKGGYFVTYGEYDKKEFKYILNKLDREIAELIKVKSLKEEKPIREKAIVKKKEHGVKRLSAGEIARIIHKVGNRCCYPNCDETDALDVHHIIPIEKGGTNKESNLIVLCPNHHRKADRGLISRERLKLYSVTKKKKGEL